MAKQRPKSNTTENVLVSICGTLLVAGRILTDILLFIIGGISAFIGGKK